MRAGHGWTILPLAPILAEVALGALTAALLIDAAPVRRLALSFSADRPAPRRARFAGKAVFEVMADRVERGVWPGQLLGEGSSDRILE